METSHRHKKVERKSEVRPAHGKSLIHRVGQGRMSKTSRQSAADLYKREVEAVVKAAMTITQGAGRKTISTKDVNYAVGSLGDCMLSGVLGAEE